MTERVDGLASPAQEWPIGHEPEPFHFVVTPELNQQYLFAVEDFDPQYLGEDARAHPSLLLSMSNSPKSPSYRLADGTGGMVAREVTEFCGRARVGQEFVAKWRLIDSYEKRGRLYNVIETHLVEVETGVEVLRRVIHETYTSPS